VVTVLGKKVEKNKKKSNKKMTERAHKQIEQWIPEVKEFEKYNIFTSPEIKEIIKKQRDFEYRLQRRIVKESDFEAYIKFLKSLEELRFRRRSSGMAMVHSDVSIVKRIHYLYQRVCYTFNTELLWLEYLHYCLDTKSFHQFTTLVSKGIQLDTSRLSLWLLAIQYEFKWGSITNCRVLIQKSIRCNQESKELWIEYFRLEVLFMIKVLLRFKVLGLDSAGSLGTEITIGTEKEVVVDEEIINPSVDIPSVTLDSTTPDTDTTSIPNLIFQSGVKQFGLGFGLECISILKKFISGSGSSDKKIRFGTEQFETTIPAEYSQQVILFMNSLIDSLYSNVTFITSSDGDGSTGSVGYDTHSLEVIKLWCEKSTSPSKNTTSIEWISTVVDCYLQLLTVAMERVAVIHVAQQSLLYLDFLASLIATNPKSTISDSLVADGGLLAYVKTGCDDLYQSLCRFDARISSSTTACKKTVTPAILMSLFQVSGNSTYIKKCTRMSGDDEKMVGMIGNGEDEKVIVDAWCLLIQSTIQSTTGRDRTIVKKRKLNHKSNSTSESETKDTTKGTETVHKMGDEQVTRLFKEAIEKTKSVRICILYCQYACAVSDDLLNDDLWVVVFEYCFDFLLRVMGTGGGRDENGVYELIKWYIQYLYIHIHKLKSSLMGKEMVIGQMIKKVSNIEMKMNLEIVKSISKRDSKSGDVSWMYLMLLELCLEFVGSGVENEKSDWFVKKITNWFFIYVSQRKNSAISTNTVAINGNGQVGLGMIRSDHDDEKEVEKEVVDRLKEKEDIVDSLVWYLSVAATWRPIEIVQVYRQCENELQIHGGASGGVKDEVKNRLQKLKCEYQQIKKRM
jgi:hypothetical protein